MPGQSVFWIFSLLTLLTRVVCAAGTYFLMMVLQSQMLLHYGQFRHVLNFAFVAVFVIHA